MRYSSTKSRQILYMWMCLNTLQFLNKKMAALCCAELRLYFLCKLGIMCLIWIFLFVFDATAQQLQVLCMIQVCSTATQSKELVTFYLGKEHKVLPAAVFFI